MRSGWRWLPAGLLAATFGANGAEPANALASAVTGGSVSLDLRLRAEHADNESAAQTEDAHATTLRTRLGFTTAKWNDVELGLDYEGVTAYDKLDYNDTTAATTQAARPGIADPAGSEMNQAWMRYSGIPGTTLQAGRQRLLLDNQRWVGNVGWRQNEQTFDGAVLVNRSIPGAQLTYAYFHNVNSVIFTNFPVKAHLANASYSPGPWLKATVYGYWLDFAAPGTGNRQDGVTEGLRLAGTPGLDQAGTAKLLYTAEYAKQRVHADASSAADDGYFLGELGGSIGAAHLKLGYEVLGSNDGSYAVQTPLATLHAHDGWADMFLVTPVTGLRRSFATLGSTLAGVALTGVYHRFAADFGGADYGSELDVSAGYAFSGQLAALVKYANYDATGTPATTFATNVDTEKGWLQLEYRF